MREEVRDTRPLVAFLYVLMRDEITPGRVERLLRDHVENNSDIRAFCNPHLAQHAQELAERLQEKDTEVNDERG